ncbi:ABC transporter ATP-binding protein/permease [Gammaproteobacteria bacterium]|nr:ABC transporter ATP-binding protein/permease [Gammaproteobacteria bacterium]
MSYLESIRYLLGKKFKLLGPLVIVFIFSSLFDIVGIGLIGGYVAIIIDPSFATLIQQKFQLLQYFNEIDNEQVILIIGYALLATFIIKFFLVLFTNYLIFHFAHLEQAKIQKIMINGFLYQDYETFILSKNAESLASISSYSSVYKEVLQSSLQVLSSFIVILAAFIMLAIISFKTVLMLVTILFLIFFTYNFLLSKRINSYGEVFTEGAANLLRGTSEAAHGLKEIKALGKERFFIDSVSDSAEMIAQNGLRLNLLSLIPRNLIEVALIGFIVAVISVSIISELNLTSTLSLLSIFAGAMIRISPLISQMQTSANALIFGKQSILLLAKIMKDQGEDIDLDTTHFKQSDSVTYQQDGKSTFEQLKLENISYKYPNASKPSINEVNLEINKGDYIGLIGPSGAGKTTLVDIILGFLKPSAGKLKFNSQDAHKDIKSWLAYCAYLPQDIFLIDGTLQENITLSRDAIDPTTLEEALKLSKLSPILKDLPDGLNTDLGDRGVRLSGGQKQRVAIARAIFNKREVLILDESTSALDSETEAGVIAELMTLRNEKTIISIAHRISTLRECNKIYRVIDGRVEGPFSYKEISSNKD